MTKPTLEEAIETVQRAAFINIINYPEVADAWAVVKEAAEKGAIDTEIYDEVREELEDIEEQLKLPLTENALAWIRGAVIGLRYKREAREAFPQETKQ